MKRAHTAAGPAHSRRRGGRVVRSRPVAWPSSRGLPRTAAEARGKTSVAPKSATSRESARALLREYHERGNLQARERLIQQYMPLVKGLARRHSTRGEPYEDLVQVGCIGLIKAVDRFDPQRAEFGAFAIPNVAGEIKRYLRDRAWPIRVPRRLQELRPGLCACSAELSAQLERQATISEIAEYSGVAEPEVAAALGAEWIQSSVTPSAGANQEDNKGSGDLGVFREGGYEQGEQRALLAAGFRALDDRERRLLHLRFFAGLSQPEIAREVGISKTQVSRLTRQALGKLRAEIGPVQSAAPAPASR